MTERRYVLPLHRRGHPAWCGLLLSDHYDL